MDHPRLYWNVHCTPGSEWLRLTPIEVPKDRVWTANDDNRHLSPWIGLPGYRFTVGMARQLILPDADLERILPDLIGSCFGSAGQRCLAGSVLVAVGDRVRQDVFVEAFIRAAGELKLGDGLDDTATLCPVVNPVEEKRIRAAIERGVVEGARLRLDGRFQTVPPEAAGLLHRADGLRRGYAGDVYLPRRDLWSGGERGACL